MAAICAGETRQQPPNARTPAASQLRALPVTDAAPVQFLAAASQDSPLLG